jgi:hypothetical protein
MAIKRQNASEAKAALGKEIILKAKFFNGAATRTTEEKRKTHCGTAKCAAARFCQRWRDSKRPVAGENQRVWLWVHPQGSGHIFNPYPRASLSRFTIPHAKKCNEKTAIQPQ